MMMVVNDDKIMKYGALLPEKKISCFPFISYHHTFSLPCSLWNNVDKLKILRWDEVNTRQKSEKKKKRSDNKVIVTHRHIVRKIKKKKLANKSGVENEKFGRSRT